MWNEGQWMTKSALRHYLRYCWCRRAAVVVGSMGQEEADD
jgi:hypothetical protein